MPDTHKILITMLVRFKVLEKSTIEKNDSTIPN